MEPDGHNEDEDEGEGEGRLCGLDHPQHGQRQQLDEGEQVHLGRTHLHTHTSTQHGPQVISTS